VCQDYPVFGAILARGGPMAKAIPDRATVKFSIWIRPDLLDQARAAAAFVGRDTPGYSFTRLLDEALERELRRLQRRHRGGRAFPEHSGGLKRGARSQQV
jgi:hypothetical protein